MARPLVDTLSLREFQTSFTTTLIVFIQWIMIDSDRKGASFLSPDSVPKHCLDLLPRRWPSVSPWNLARKIATCGLACSLGCTFVSPPGSGNYWHYVSRRHDPVRSQKRWNLGSWACRLGGVAEHKVFFLFWGCAEIDYDYFLCLIESSPPKFFESWLSSPDFAGIQKQKGRGRQGFFLKLSTRWG